MENQLAARLSDFIKETGLSKRKFAEKVGVSAMSVSDWTTGKIQPNAESIFFDMQNF